MSKTTIRIGNQPGERQKCASVHPTKPEPQRKAASSVRKGDSNETEMETSKASKGKELRVKKCKPRAAPEIRHTLASKLRLVKANPLLEVSGAITLPPSVKKSLIASILKENVQPLQFRAEDDAKPFNTVQPKQVKNNKNMAHKVQQKREPERINPNNVLQPKEDNDRNKQQSVVQQRLNGKSKPLNTVQQRKEIWKNKTAIQPSSTALQSKRPVIMKTSLATKNRVQVTDKKILHRTVTFSNLPRKSTVNMRRSRSASDLPSPIQEDEDIGEPKVFVKTPIPGKSRPSSAQRQSFRRSNSWRRSMYAPMPKVLRENLERWLQKHGKAATSFHHLNCFVLKASDISNPSAYSKAEENDILNSTFTADDSSISQAAAGELGVYIGEEEDTENIKDAKSVVENTLKDLLQLINMGYPQDRCEEWLHLIQKHFYNVREEPTYWECRAALEESSHDLQAAISCYEQAIIQGAMPEEISKSLDGLMEKFNLLHLDPEENKLNSKTKPTHRHILDARNIFKSSIIKFALQQRKNKRPATPGEVKATASHYVVTPVRRSARILSSGYRSTPRLTCVSSLNQLEDGIRQSLVFKPNSALEP